MKIGDKVKLITYEKSLLSSMCVELNSKGKILYIDEKDNTAKIKFDNNILNWLWINLDCVKLIENNMQILTRKQLITLHSQFTCKEWKTTIEELLKENVLEDKIDVSSKLELLKSIGTEEQKEAVKKLKIILPKSYLELHNESGLKVGDKVRVVRKATNKEQGWNNSWTKDMDVCVGNNYEIIYNREDNGFALNCIEIFSFPYFVLEKVEEKYVPYTFEDNIIGKVIQHKTESRQKLIISGNKKSVYLHSEGNVDYEYLLKYWTELDGSPLGKLIEIN